MFSCYMILIPDKFMVWLLDVKYKILKILDQNVSKLFYEYYYLNALRIEFFFICYCRNDCCSFFK